MKPQNWDSLPKQEKATMVVSLLNSTRGTYIVGQALARAVEVMKKEKYPETSNIEDMEMLGEIGFPLGYTLTLNRKKLMPRQQKPVTFKGTFKKEE